ncbi:MAG: polysaccharide deacetylase family protein [Pseudomonadota bacterium]
MADLGYFSQKIGSAIDRVLCERFERRERELPQGRFVSLCFDDFPKSAVETAAPMIEAQGWRATWYVAGGYLAATEPKYGAMFDATDLARLQQTNHDFGCHTYDHVDCRAASADEIDAQCRRNLALMREHGVTDVKSFAYPFGAANLSSKKNLSTSEMALRGVKPGLNRGEVDLNMLKACGLQKNNGGIDRAMADLQTLTESAGWLILFTHDVRDAPSPWGVTPEDYRTLLGAIADSGADVVTVGEMMTRLERPLEHVPSVAA